METEDQNQEGEGQQPDIEEQGTQIEVPADPPAGGEGGEPARQNRKERREERGRNMAAENRALQERIERTERERQADRESLAELRGRLEAGEKLRDKPTSDPDQDRLTAIETEMEDAVAEMGKGLPGALKRWHALRREEGAILARQAAGTATKEAEERISRSIPQRGDPRLDAITAEYPFLGAGDARSLQIKAIANGHVNRLILSERRDMENPDVRYATLREGAALAARDAGIQTRRAPTDTERDRFAGTRGGDSGGSNGPVRVHLTAGQMKMAEATFNSLPAAEAHQKWWATIGSKVPSK